MPFVSSYQAQSESSWVTKFAAVFAGGDKVDGTVAPGKDESPGRGGSIEIGCGDDGGGAAVGQFANGGVAFSDYQFVAGIVGVGGKPDFVADDHVVRGPAIKASGEVVVMRRCWRHNLATALIASQWSGEYKVDSETAYTFGLLAGLGRLALLVSDPEVYSRLAERAQTEKPSAGDA